MFNMDVQDIQDLLIVTFLSVQFSQTGFLPKTFTYPVHPVYPCGLYDPGRQCTQSVDGRIHRVARLQPPG